MTQPRPARIRRVLPLALLLPAAALISAGPAAASEGGGSGDPHPSAKPTVVLVHGAWADASGWSEVTESLQAKGYPVVATANPLRSLTGDSAYLAARLKTIKGPIVLVGHSYGGAVVTNAATGNPNLKSLVYIAAFAPRPPSSWRPSTPAAASRTTPRRPSPPRSRPYRSAVVPPTSTCT
ncbi:alpha/beta hydrolase [Streptomyces sp. NPDC006978]|uniref:alpha/beta hydrolase n=1 Tax=unclassified Streptomyces TaxID=2593676 RepID=UPI002AFFD462|nr:alpha/beta hydrolase [Streptomyces sp. S584]